MGDLCKFNWTVHARREFRAPERNEAKARAARRARKAPPAALWHVRAMAQLIERLFHLKIIDPVLEKSIAICSS
jgi:hypothetical protein